MEKHAFKLIQQYITGWKQNDLNIILSCLSGSVTVIESHGPTYTGTKEIEKWFEFWMNANSHVVLWDIKSFIFCDQDETAFFEWDFSCISNGETYLFPGISKIKFLNEKIDFIHEYRMTRKPFDWRKDKLISE